MNREYTRVSMKALGVVLFAAAVGICCAAVADGQASPAAGVELSVEDGRLLPRDPGQSMHIDLKPEREAEQ